MEGLTWKDCVWPVMAVHGVPPTISDGFGADKRKGDGHFGADIMHRRPKTSPWPEEKNREGKVNSAYCIYEGEWAYSIVNGTVYDSEMTGSGWTVRISHRIQGLPILSVYRHLKSSPLKKGDLVIPGTGCGPIGDNPASPGDPPHLHFELWNTSQNNQALVQRFAGREGGKWGEYLKWVIDPASVMHDWKMLDYDGAVGPHPSPPPKPLGGSGGSGGKLVAVLAFLGLGGLLLKSRRRYV